MNFPLNIPSDDAAIFSENSDSQPWDSFSDDGQDTEDPTGPRGQAKENEKEMFRTPVSKAHKRRIKIASGFATGRISKLTPGARKIP